MRECMGIAGVVIAVSQIMQNDMCIEKLPNINFSGIISDTKWTYEPYRIFKFGVNLQARKMRLYNNQKGKSIGLDSPPPDCDKDRISQEFSNLIFATLLD